MERKMKKLLVILLLVCMIVPSVPQKAEATGEEVSGTTRRQFVSNDGYNADTGDFGQQQFDEKKLTVLWEHRVMRICSIQSFRVQRMT